MEDSNKTEGQVGLIPKTSAGLLEDIQIVDGLKIDGEVPSSCTKSGEYHYNKASFDYSDAEVLAILCGHDKDAHEQDQSFVKRQFKHFWKVFLCGEQGDRCPTLDGVYISIMRFGFVSSYPTPSGGEVPQMSVEQIKAFIKTLPESVIKKYYDNSIFKNILEAHKGDTSEIFLTKGDQEKWPFKKISVKDLMLCFQKTVSSFFDKLTHGGRLNVAQMSIEGLKQFLTYQEQHENVVGRGEWDKILSSQYLKEAHPLFQYDKWQNYSKEEFIRHLNSLIPDSCKAGFFDILINRSCDMNNALYLGLLKHVDLSDVQLKRISNGNSRRSNFENRSPELLIELLNTFPTNNRKFVIKQYPEIFFQVDFFKRHKESVAISVKEADLNELYDSNTEITVAGVIKKPFHPDAKVPQSENRYRMSLEGKKGAVDLPVFVSEEQGACEGLKLRKTEVIVTGRLKKIGGNQLLVLDEVTEIRPLKTVELNSGGFTLEDFIDFLKIARNNSTDVNEITTAILNRFLLSLMQEGVVEEFLRCVDQGSFAFYRTYPGFITLIELAKNKAKYDLNKQRPEYNLKQESTSQPYARKAWHVTDEVLPEIGQDGVLVGAKSLSALSSKGYLEVAKQYQEKHEYCQALVAYKLAYQVSLHDEDNQSYLQHLLEFVEVYCAECFQTNEDREEFFTSFLTTVSDSIENIVWSKAALADMISQLEIAQLSKLTSGLDRALSGLKEKLSFEKHRRFLAFKVQTPWHITESTIAYLSGLCERYLDDVSAFHDTVSGFQAKMVALWGQVEALLKDAPKTSKVSEQSETLESHKLLFEMLSTSEDGVSVKGNEDRRMLLVKLAFLLRGVASLEQAFWRLKSGYPATLVQNRQSLTFSENCLLYMLDPAIENLVEDLLDEGGLTCCFDEGGSDKLSGSPKAFEFKDGKDRISIKPLSITQKSFRILQQLFGFRQNPGTLGKADLERFSANQQLSLMVWSNLSKAELNFFRQVVIPEGESQFIVKAKNAPAYLLSMAKFVEALEQLTHKYKGYAQQGGEYGQIVLPYGLIEYWQKLIDLHAPSLKNVRQLSSQLVNQVTYFFDNMLSAMHSGLSVTQEESNHQITKLILDKARNFAKILDEVHALVSRAALSEDGKVLLGRIETYSAKLICIMMQCERDLLDHQVIDRSSMFGFKYIGADQGRGFFHTTNVTKTYVGVSTLNAFLGFETTEQAVQAFIKNSKTLPDMENITYQQVFTKVKELAPPFVMTKIVFGFMIDLLKSDYWNKLNALVPLAEDLTIPELVREVNKAYTAHCKKLGKWERHAPFKTLAGLKGYIALHKGGTTDLLYQAMKEGFDNIGDRITQADEVAEVIVKSELPALVASVNSQYAMLCKRANLAKENHEPFDSIDALLVYVNAYPKGRTAGIYHQIKHLYNNDGDRIKQTPLTAAGQFAASGEPKATIRQLTEKEQKTLFAKDNFGL